MSRALIYSSVYAIGIATARNTVLLGRLSMDSVNGAGEVDIIFSPYGLGRVTEELEQRTQRNWQALGLDPHTSRIEEIYSILGLNNHSRVGDFFMSVVRVHGPTRISIERKLPMSRLYENPDIVRWRHKWPMLTDEEFRTLSSVSFVHDFNRDFQGILHARPIAQGRGA